MDRPSTLLEHGRNSLRSSPPSRSMICVLGMHRAGTSATAGAISRLGIDLGPPQHLMIARTDNPAGFFEHQPLTDLNDEILHRLGGSWHEPPVLGPGWAGDSGLQDLRERAYRILREDFDATVRWGWKDPRTCLTLPFWQPLLPDVRYVVCVRHPFEVARSLQARNGFSIEKGVALWMQHMTLAVRHLASSPTLLVVYNDLLEHTGIEIDRMAAFIGAEPVDAAARDAAIQSITNDLRHYRSAPDALFNGDGPWHDAAAFYVFLRSLAALQLEQRYSPDAPVRFGEWLALHVRREQEGRLAIHEAANLRQTLEAARVEAARAIEDLRVAVDQRQRALDAMTADASRSRDAWHSTTAALEQARATIDGLEDQRNEQAALLEHLQTPSGAFKLSLRAWLPARAHGLLRRWGVRVFPGLSRDPRR